LRIADANSDEADSNKSEHGSDRRGQNSTTTTTTLLAVIH
jgi:hypothetical protein